MTAHDQDERGARRRLRRVAAGVGAGLAVLAALALWTRDSGEEGRALTQLPAAERRALYERTRQTLASTCAPELRPAGLLRYCREQAELILRFPECDQACRELAERNAAKPTR